MTRQRQLSLPNWEIKRPEKFSGSLKSRTGIDTQLSIWHGCALFCTLPRRLLRLGYPLELVALDEYKIHEVLLVRDMVNSDVHFPRCLKSILSRKQSRIWSRLGGISSLACYVFNQGFCLKHYSEWFST